VPLEARDLGERRARARRQAAPCLGQRHGPVGADEERLAELDLEVPDVPADRRGRQAQLVGRAREALVACRRFEGAQGGQVGQTVHA